MIPLVASVRLKRLDGSYAVCRLEPSAPFPDWAEGGGFVSISRSDDELSVVCGEPRVPPDVHHDGGWTCYKFVGPFAFDESGIVSSVIGPLSEAGLGIFVVSTFDGILVASGHSLV